MLAPPSSARPDEARVAAYAREIRRLDFRFLLPTPPGGVFERLVLLGGTPSLARHAVALGVAREVSETLPTGTVADAVVWLHGAPVGLARAAACLAPGGVLYAEMERGSRVDGVAVPGRVCSRLARAGVRRPALYWCPPDFERHDAYVPLASPGAIGWYLANRRPGSLWAGARGWTLRRLARVGENAVGSMLPRWVVTGVMAGGGASCPSLLGHPDLPEELRRPGLHLLLIAAGNRRVVLLPFTRDGSYPIAALKLSREGYHNGRAGVEQRVLGEVYGQVGETLRPTIPRPYGWVRWGGLLASVEGGLPGRVLNASRSGAHGASRRRVEDLRCVVEWLAEFHRQTEVRRVRWAEAGFARALEDDCAGFVRDLPAAASERRFLAEVLRRSVAAADTLVPVVRCHGDLHSGNVVRSNDRLGVIDWVDGALGPPFVDLFNFVLEWSARGGQGGRDAASPAQRFERLLLDPGQGDALSTAVDREIRRYAAAMEIDPRLIPILLVLFLVQRAGFHRRMAEQERSSTHRGFAQMHASCIRVLATRPERLFDRWIRADDERVAADPTLPRLRRGHATWATS